MLSPLAKHPNILARRFRRSRNGYVALREGFAIRETAMLPCEKVSPMAKRLCYLTRRFRHWRQVSDGWIEKTNM